MTLIQQIGVGGMNEGIGFLNDMFGASSDTPQGYIPMIWALSILGLLALIFSIWLRAVETGPNSHGLEKPVKHIH